MVRNLLQLRSGNARLLPRARPAGELDAKLLRDLLEIRVMLLGWTAAKAAQRSGGTPATALRDALSRLEQATDTRSIQEADFDFFEELVGLNPRSFWEALPADDPKLQYINDIRAKGNLNTFKGL